MKESEARKLWMEAHLRLNSKSPPDSWSPAEVYFSFATLRPPAVSFEDWCTVFGIEVEDERAEANSRALEAIKGDPLVKVETVSP